MKRVKGFGVALLVCVLLGVGGIAFATGEKEEKASSTPVADSGLQANLEYWSSYNANENQGQIIQEAADEFMKLNPKVKITITFNGRDNRTLAGSAIQAGTKVDMMDAVADNIKARWENYLMDLTPYLSKTYPTTGGKTLEECLMPSMVSLSKKLFGGKVMYIPFIPQAYMITCNKNIFDVVGIKTYPKTWDEFLTDCEIIKKAGYIPISSDSFYCNSWLGYYLTRLMGNDAVVKLANDPAAWSDPKVLEGARAISHMAKAGYFDPDIASMIYPNAQQNMVINENIAMYINGTWLPNEVAASTAPDYHWGFFAYPTVPGGVDGQESLCYSSFGIAVNKNCTQNEADAAVAFAAFIDTSKYDQLFADKADAIPVNVASTWPENLSEARVVFDQCTNRYPSQTAFFLNNKSKQVITDACLRLMSNKITPEQFVVEASKF
jgi:raffinose/stachyose/melibiose transport system substrate-binding protein